MISEAALAEIRVAATLVHTLPGLVMVLSDGPRDLAEVGWSAAPVHTGPTTQPVHPCDFHQHVAQAWARHRDGGESQFLNLAGDPAVDLRPDAGADAWPSGIVRTPVNGRSIYAFGTTLAPDACAELGDDVLGAPGPDGEELLVSLQGDTDTEVTIVFVEIDDERHRVSDDPALDLLERLIVCY